jgi:hypothetical protein
MWRRSRTCLFLEGRHLHRNLSGNLVGDYLKVFKYADPKEVVIATSAASGC